METSSKTIILQEYQQKRYLYRDFSHAVKSLLEQLLAHGEVKFQQISCREKDDKKLDEKIDRKTVDGKIYNNLTDVEDLAGVRIIFYLEEDKSEFIKLLRKEFGEDGIISSVGKLKLRGYRADHFILKLNPERECLAEYKRFQGLKCELQLTTALHHAWSELEHDVVYKPNGDKELLKSLGFDVIAEGFEEIMEKHIIPASLRFAHLVKMNKAMSTAADFFGRDFLTELVNAKDNDSLYEYLEILEQFAHRKSPEVTAALQIILSKPALEKVERLRFGKKIIYGKSSTELRLKCIEVFSQLRYIRTDDFLQVAQKMSSHNEDETVRKKTLDFIKSFAEYDLNVLPKVGYAPQRHVLDFMLLWNEAERTQSLDFIETACKELLNTAAEGRINSTPDTMTLSFAAIDPTDFLRKIRHDTIDLLVATYHIVKNERDRLRIVKTVHQAFELPHNVQYGENLEALIVLDIEYVIPIWSDLIFDEAGQLKCELSVAEEVYGQLARLKRTERNFTQSARMLMEKLSADPLYKKASLLVGNDFTHGIGDDFTTNQAVRNEAINNEVAELTNENIDTWIEHLNKIAKSYGLIAEWQYQPFSSCLQKISEKFPDLAQAIIQDGLLHEKPLTHFCADFLHGFRRAKRMDIWDSVASQMIAKKSIEYTKSLCWALMIDSGLDVIDHIREKDVQLLCEIAQRDGNFNFAKEDIEKDFNYHHVLVNALTRNLAASPETLFKLLLIELNAFSAMSSLFAKELHAALIRSWLKPSNVDDDFKKKILNWLVTLPNLDWEAQEIIVQFTDNYAKKFLDFFLERIQYDIALKKDEEKDNDEAEFEYHLNRYEAIPYHFGSKIRSMLEGDPNLLDLADPLLKKMTDDWSLYNWHVSKLLGHCGKGFQVIVSGLLNKGGPENIRRAVNLLSGFDCSDFDAVIMVARQAEDDEIFSRLGSMLTSTGVVSGEDGIAKAYEQRSKQLMEYANDPNEKFRIFAVNAAASLKQAADFEYVRTNERKEMRKIEFES